MGTFILFPLGKGLRKRGRKKSALRIFLEKLSDEDITKRIRDAQEKGERPQPLLYQILRERGIILGKNKIRYYWDAMDDEEIIEKAKKLGLIGKNPGELVKLPGGASLYKEIIRRREVGNEELYDVITKKSEKFYLKPLKEKIFLEEQEVKLKSYSIIEKIVVDFIREYDYKNYKFDESKSEIEYSDRDGTYYINFKNYENTYASIKKYFCGEVSNIDVEIKRAIIGKGDYKNYKRIYPVLRLCDEDIALDFGPIFEISII
ncbi:MAG: hypothetical protein QW244_01930 [Candidatus Pacearchaeota archaeon]